MGFAYVATPYSKYPDGIHFAWLDACVVTAELLKKGMSVYSPIVHTHPIAIHGGVNPLDHDIWLPFDKAMMDAAESLIVVKMKGWAESVGVAHEIAAFQAAGKKIVFYDAKELGLPDD